MGEQEQLQYKARISAGTGNQQVEGTLPPEVAYGTVGQVIDQLLTNAPRSQHAVVQSIRDLRQGGNYFIRANNNARVRENDPVRDLFVRQDRAIDGVMEDCYAVDFEIASANSGGLERRV